MLTQCFFYNYRVFNKEGQKVLGYKTMKKCAFEATNRLIASKNIGHFVIFVIEKEGQKLQGYNTT